MGTGNSKVTNVVWDQDTASILDKEWEKLRLQRIKLNEMRRKKFERKVGKYMEGPTCYLQEKEVLDKKTRELEVKEGEHTEK